MKRRVEIILIGLIVAVFSLAIIILLAQRTQIANVLVAWATLMLAFAAFMSILHSREQERRRRKEEQLNEVMQWVDGILKYCAVYSQGLEAARRDEFLWAVTELKLRIDYITSVAEGFGKELSEPLGNATDIFALIYDKLRGEEAEREKLEGHCIEVKKAISLLRSK